VVGKASDRLALILQFAPGSQPFTEQIIAGATIAGTLIFYPGAESRRAKFLDRTSTSPTADRPAGQATIDRFFDDIALQLARQPWMSNFGGVLRDVRFATAEENWSIVDIAGRSLPLHDSEYMEALATSGGYPFDLSGEWDGRRFRPLGMITDGTFLGVLPTDDVYA